MKSEASYDVIVLGAGAAGLMCAAQVAKSAKKVLLVDHMPKVGSKILISGGGRCNFTNLQTGSQNFVSQNEHFCKSALSRYSPEDFCKLVKEYQIPFHEKKLGQLFCDHSARDIVSMLEAECKKNKVKTLLNAKIGVISRSGAEMDQFSIEINSEEYRSTALVVATGGLSIPKIGASGVGYKIAKDFGLEVIPTRPALDGFTFTDPAYNSLKELSGLSIDCVLTACGQAFRENILFTHKGLSGPAALQGSLYWKESEFIHLNLLPEKNLSFQLRKLKEARSHESLFSFLSKHLPQRFVEVFCENFLKFPERARLSLPQVSEDLMTEWSKNISDWKLKPSGTVGYSKAEVTKGGVSTAELSSKTLESKKVPGLYFIGEVVDVTGWLGGYNFQWAWASAHAAAQAIVTTESI